MQWFIGPCLFVALALSLRFSWLGVFAAPLFIYSFYTASKLWVFDRLASISLEHAKNTELWESEPLLNKDAIARILLSRPDHWDHVPQHTLVWNPRRADLYTCLLFNPVCSLLLVSKQLSCLGAILISLSLASGASVLFRTLDAAHTMTMEATQKQAEHEVWAATRKASTPTRVVRQASTASSEAFLRQTSNASIDSFVRKPSILPTPTSSSPFINLVSPASSAPSSPVSVSSLANTSASSANTTANTSINISANMSASDMTVPRLRPLVPPPQNPRRTSSYRLHDLEVPQMAPRRVASMASNNNLRKQFQQAV